MGEYWIDGSCVTFADGDADVGIDNHEMVVWKYLFGELTNSLEGVPGAESLRDGLLPYVADGSGEPVWLRTYVSDETDHLFREGEITREAYDDYVPWLCQLSGWSAERLELLLSSDSDLREYAMQHLGWIRVSQDDSKIYVQLYGLSDTKLRYLQDGLWEAYDTDAFKSDYCVSVGGPDTVLYYDDVKFDDLQSIAALSGRNRHRLPV